MTTAAPIPESAIAALPPAALHGGQALLAAGAVLECHCESLDDMVVITGRVSGDDGAAHRCWIGIEDDQLDADCSCSERRDCVHLAALLLQAAGNDSQPEAVERLGVADEINPTATLAIVIDQHGADHRITLAALRVAVQAGQQSETPYLLERARESRQPSYINSRQQQWLVRLLQAGELSADGRYIALKPADSLWLPELIADLQCHWRSASSPRLQLQPALTVDCVWQTRADGAQRLQLDLSALDSEATDDEETLILPTCPPLRIHPRNGGCQRLDGRHLPPDLCARIMSRGWINPDQIAAVHTQIEQQATSGSAPRPAVREICPVSHAEPQPQLLFTTQEPAPDAPAQAVLQLSFGYGPVRFSPIATASTALLDEQRVASVQRDRDREQAVVDQLQSLGLNRLNRPDRLTLASDDLTTPDSATADLWAMTDARQQEAAWARAQQQLAALGQSGWQLQWEDAFPHRLVQPDDWYGTIEAVDQQQLELELGVIIEGQRHSLIAALLAWLDKVPASWLRRMLDAGDADESLWLRLDAQRIVPLPAKRLRTALLGLVEWSDHQHIGNDRLRLPLERLPLLAEFTAFWQGDGASDLKQLIEQLQHIDQLDPVAPPPAFRATLRHYQQRGLAWLQLLRQHGFGGVLADDMGLGKTLQTLAHIALEKAAGRLDRPCLIVAPASLLFNWRAEARRFAPMLSVLTLHGPERKQRFRHMAEYDLVLTSYALVVRDAQRLQSQAFHIVVLDEAQAIKNPASATSRQVRQLQANQRIALSGTPLENHLGELWSLFRFVQPGLFGSANDFAQRFRKPIEQQADDNRLRLLRTTIAPFMLRRTKSIVAPELPEVIEIERSIELETRQQHLYEAVRLAMHEKVRLALSQQGLKGSRMVVLDALLRLRQICCDPRLIKSGHDSDKTQAGSAKLELLVEMLQTLRQQQRKVLVFSQFTSMLKLIEAELQRLELDYVTLTGSTRDRSRPVEQFQNSDIPVFLISLKAGGAGLNLTAADTVIHYDPWWNPAAQEQATGRAHRIGQQQQVFSYRLITAGTVEQRVVELQQQKRQLVDGLLAGQSTQQLAADDIEALFAPIAETA
ncbi:MAG: hypothetical protein Tsb002_32150 [Wenzhouxiangellaceae bacterium]